jgi:hypothetical protein
MLVLYMGEIMLYLTTDRSILDHMTSFPTATNRIDFPIDFGFLVIAMLSESKNYSQSHSLEQI